MKRRMGKNCGNFKAISHSDGMYNKPLTANCSHCVYFSSKNCHLDAGNDIEPEIDFI